MKRFENDPFPTPAELAFGMTAAIVVLTVCFAVVVTANLGIACAVRWAVEAATGIALPLWPMFVAVWGLEIIMILVWIRRCPESMR